MADASPKVSIGLAVYNGEQYLREAIDSILAQTFTDFELIISDNASTDRTEKICRDYAASDSRIRYYRNATNIGGANNENRTFKLSRGKYFRLAAHDDVMAKDLINKSVEVLDRNPSVVLCYSQTIEIDRHGKHLKLVDLDMASLATPYERFCYLASWNHKCEASYSLIRADILDKTDLQPNYVDSDRTLLCELGLYGQFYQIPEPLFYRREHPEKSTEVYRGWYELMTWFNPEVQGYLQCRANFSRSRQFCHYLRIISRSPLSFFESLRCYVYMGNRFLSGSWLEMIKELIWFSQYYASIWQKKVLRFSEAGK
jgi:glycosyltransferase involved in cell wall biosynthesis